MFKNRSRFSNSGHQHGLIVAAVVILGVQACATSPGDLRRREPERTFRADKPDQVTAECILESWQEAKSKGGEPIGAELQKIGERYSVLSPGNGLAIDLVDISGGEVTYYANATNFGWRKSLLADAVASCV